jgi:hypothetical protein
MLAVNEINWTLHEGTVSRALQFYCHCEENIVNGMMTPGGWNHEEGRKEGIMMVS